MVLSQWSDHSQHGAFSRRYERHRRAFDTASAGLRQRPTPTLPRWCRDDTRCGMTGRLARYRAVRRPWICLALAGCGHADSIAAVPVPTPHDAAEIAAPCAAEPHTFAPGITATRVPLGVEAATGGPACVDLVRIDLAHYRPRLLTAARDGAAHPAPAWRETFHLAAAINAGMFHDDGTPVGLLVENGIAVGTDNGKYAGYLASIRTRRPTRPR